MKKVGLIIMDGVGWREEIHGNAVAQAKTPNLKNLLEKYTHVLLQASEEAVGLPKGQMGNSEVGHLNIGAGRIVYTGLSLINKDLEDKHFFQNPAFLNAIQHAKKHNSKLHIMGLASFGGVHSNLNHILALFQLAKQHNVKTIFHAFGDGRDVPPKTLLSDFNNSIKPALEENNVSLGMISGRYYAMDRDKRWDRVNQAYEILVGLQKKTFDDADTYIQQMYDQNITDEFIVPAINAHGVNVKLDDNDAVIFANFRPDRAREMSHMIFGSTYYDYLPNVRKQNLYFVTMMTYEGITPTAVAYPPTKIKNLFGEILARNNLHQLRIAETEKYAHVTFFFDGGEETTFPNEKKIIVNSPKVATYDLKPEMSAVEVCDKLLAEMPNNDVFICNFANGDMVGHTGKLQPTIKAIETIDTQIGRIYEQAQKLGYTLFITADHGNADEVTDANNNEVTSHTLNPVPFIVTDANIHLMGNGKLANIAPTILKYLGLPIPEEMDQPLF